jgi:hypothetical protein
MGEDGGETLQEGAHFVQSDGGGTSQDEDPGKAAEGKGGALAVHLGEGPREASWASRVRPRRRWGYGEKGLLHREGKAQTCRGRPPPGLDRASRPGPSGYGGGVRGHGLGHKAKGPVAGWPPPPHQPPYPLLGTSPLEACFTL